VVLAGLEEDAIARADELDRSALALAEADAFGQEDRLAVRCVCQAVRAPGMKCTAAAPSGGAAAIVSM
jgi:hypothetical protein